MSHDTYRCLMAGFLAVLAPTSLGAEPDIFVRRGSAPSIIAAPHGRGDRGTGDIVRQVCSASRWSCPVAERFRSKTTPLNVSRPSGSVPR